MYALVLAVTALTQSLAIRSQEIAEIHTRSFLMPLYLNVTPTSVEKVSFFVSRDRGETWNHVKDYEPTAHDVHYSAVADGEHWFTVQVVFKDGRRNPEQLGQYMPMKVRVNTERTALKPAKKTRREMQEEIDDLRMTVDALKKRIDSLESAPKKAKKKRGDKN